MSHRVREIRRPDDLAPLAEDWDALLRRTPQADFFRSLPWFQTYWRHSGGRAKLRVLVVEDAGEVQGILPLAILRQATRLGRVRVLGFPLDHWGTFYGPVGAEPSATLEVCCQHLAEGSQRDWDYVEFDGLAESLSADLLATSPWRFERDRGAEVSLVTLDGRWDEYWSGRTSKWRNNVRRNARRLGPAVRYLRFRPAPKADPRWDLYDACCRLAAKSWQGSSGSGTTLSHAGVATMLRHMHATAVAVGAVDLNLLYIDRRPIAFAYNYVTRGHVSGLRTGFDPDFPGAGSVLMRYALSDSFTRGDRCYDLGADYGAAKKNWQTAVIGTHRYRHYRPTAIRAQLLRLKRRWSARATARSKA